MNTKETTTQSKHIKSKYDDRIEVYQAPGDQDALMKLKSQMESLVTAVHQYNHNYNFIDLVYQYVLDKELMLSEILNHLAVYSSMDTSAVPLLRELVSWYCQEKVFGICKDLSIVLGAFKGQNTPLCDQFYKDLESYQKKLRSKAEVLKKLDDLENEHGDLIRLKRSIQYRLEIAYEELEVLYAKYEKSTENAIKRMDLLAKIQAIGLDELMISSRNCLSSVE
ncbi:hypothetical protein DLAC_06373 [Tieghemostelium lacteum]|uniref:Uncharacterized protein n=1 Tax=Tieghemostelium lacteum TaxID=361077 RepID=A0A151ZEM0_TIELA|nr:hypothetical protein DLAC_06373 [Tieghemostelium lacteum]|eukprot:KYQ92401.1 hypothetical protein DLAC_06373 [Tieghemostelium lacteum]